MSKKKKSFLPAMLQCKCPHCRTGNLFVNPPISLKFNKMHSHCPHCQGELEPEPGFYIGAMYVSYAFNTAIMVIMFLSVLIFLDPEELWVYFAAIFTPTFLFLPFNFRLSRSVYLHLFGGYTYQKDLSEIK